MNKNAAVVMPLLSRQVYNDGQSSPYAQHNFAILATPFLLINH